MFFVSELKHLPYRVSATSSLEPEVDGRGLVIRPRPACQDSRMKWRRPSTAELVRSASGKPPKKANALSSNRQSVRYKECERPPRLAKLPLGAPDCYRQRWPRGESAGDQCSATRRKIAADTFASTHPGAFIGLGSVCLLAAASDIPSETSILLAECSLIRGSFRMNDTTLS